MARIAVEPQTPPWWGRAATAIEKAMGERPSKPTALWRAATTAALPAAADFPGCMAFHVALAVPVISDGTSWFPITVGAAL